MPLSLEKGQGGWPSVMRLSPPQQRLRQQWAALKEGAGVPKASLRDALLHGPHQTSRSDTCHVQVPHGLQGQWAWPPAQATVCTLIPSAH